MTSPSSTLIEVILLRIKFKFSDAARASVRLYLAHGRPFKFGRPEAQWGRPGARGLRPQWRLLKLSVTAQRFTVTVTAGPGHGTRHLRVTCPISMDQFQYRQPEPRPPAAAAG